MKIFRNAEVMWREEDESLSNALDGLARNKDISDVGTSILFSDGVMLSLNMLGTEIWKRCDGRRLEEIITELTAQFEVDPASLKQDVLVFLSELSGKGFIRYED